MRRAGVGDTVKESLSHSPPQERSQSVPHFIEPLSMRRTSRVRVPFNCCTSAFKIPSKQSARSRLHSHVFRPPSYTPGTRSDGASKKLSASSLSSCVFLASACSPSISHREISWKRASKRSRRASVSDFFPPDNGIERGEYEINGGRTESYPGHSVSAVKKNRIIEVCTSESRGISVDGFKFDCADGPGSDDFDASEREIFENSASSSSSTSTSKSNLNIL